MKTKIALIAFLVLFVGFCSFLIMDSGLFNNCQYHSNRIIPLASESPKPTLFEGLVSLGQSYDFSQLKASNAPSKNVILGSTDPDSGYEFALQLSSKGAGIENAIMSKFDDRDPQDPQPLVILSPIEEGVTKPILSMANGSFERGLKRWKTNLKRWTELWSASVITRTRNKIMGASCQPFFHPRNASRRR